MLAVSGTVVNASVNLTRPVAATRESESDRVHVRFSDLLMCADFTDLRSRNRPNSTVYSPSFCWCSFHLLMDMQSKSGWLIIHSDGLPAEDHPC